MLFVVGAVLQVATLCVAAGFPLSGVIGFSRGARPLTAICGHRVADLFSGLVQLVAEME